MKKGKKLQLDRDHLIQMVRSPDFYVQCPAFLYLKDVALLSWKMLQEKKDCVKCHHEWKAMQGVCDALFMKLRELKAQNDPAIADVKAWLSKRKGYAISGCVLYYRRSRSQGKIAKFEF